MTSSLVFATGNQHKIEEVAAMLPSGMQLRGLADIGCTEALPETTPTIPGNALQKARYVYDHYNIDCFAEDTGLEVMALDGAPGVHSARYAGVHGDAKANMALLLSQMSGLEDRRARFRTVIALIMDHQEYLFEGIVEGILAKEPMGDGGFGYDPIFVPDGANISFAQMDAAEKNAISHRGIATRKLLDFLFSGQAPDIQE
jgi:XTP/dITP diphosphohydrolase